MKNRAQIIPASTFSGRLSSLTAGAGGLFVSGHDTVESLTFLTEFALLFAFAFAC